MANYQDLNGNQRNNAAIEKRNNRKKLEAIKRKKRRKRKKRIGVILSILVILILSLFLYINSFLNKINTNNLVGGEAPISSKDPINILLLGMDVGDVEYSENESARRSDSIMVVNYNPKTENANIVSIPRDTLIEVDAYLETGEYQKYWKINSAYTLGGEEEVITHVRSLLDIDINYIVEIDYEAFRSVVDALGGVDMYIEQDMYYDDDMQDLHINFTGGETVHLDGKKAEEFFRWRQNSDGTGLENGDIDRIKNQQLFIKKLIDKALSPSVVLKVPNILEAISKNIDTNMPSKEMVSLGLKVVKLKAEDIIMSTLNGVNEDIYGQSFYVTYKDLNQDLINSLNATSKDVKIQNTATIDKTNINVLVLNGTGIPGLAGSVREELLTLNYINVDVDNAMGVSKSSIQLNNKELEDVIKSELNIGKVTKITSDEYSDYDVVVLLGEDYDIN